MLMMIFCSSVMAQENIVNYTDKSLPILNEELRRTRSSTSANGASILSLQADIATKFDSSTGHDHDGTDSKRVDYNNLENVPPVDNALYGVAGTYSWTAPAGVDYVFVTAVGGGGGGGDRGNEGGGGGGGAFIIRAGAVVVPGNTYTVTVGAGGAAAVSGGASGSNGGESSFSGSNITISVNGGSGGGAGAGGAGGVASGGYSANTTINTGDNSGNYLTTAGGAGAMHWSGGVGGPGGGNPFGKGGNAYQVTYNPVADPPTGYGSGGYGAENATTRYAVDGRPGMVYLEW
jgi:hypothetical protein